MKTWLAFWYGIFKNNPTFRLVLGLCPTLAVTTSLENALGMGLAATFVLVCSNALVSALRKVIPGAVHIPCYIVIIATFVTAINLLMQAYLPDLSASLGIFIPLIVVNCIILGRAEAFACKNGVVDSIADGLGSGIGFTLALALVASVREIAGAGTLTVWGDIAVKGINPGPVTLAILPAGGFIVLGLLLALINRIGEWNARRHGAPAPLPINLDCRHCTMCGNGKAAEKSNAEGREVQGLKVMKCPKCGNDDDKVLDSRSARDGAAIRRRRECMKCGYRFTTYEEIDRDEVLVIKRDGTRQTFDRQKIDKAIRIACGKRPVSDEQIRTMIDHVVASIEGDEVPADKIAELVMHELHKVDEVAYIRFASVYRQFKDVAQFLSAITEIVKK